MPHSLFSIWHLFSVDENDKPLPDGPVGFEDAIKATKFGKFNLMMMAFSFLGALAFIFDTTIIPFTIPNAECDLQISLLDKGVLNAMAHSGMICSAPLVGFLADTLGRQKILFWGLFFDAICNIFATFSHSFILTAVLKFTAGFFVGGTNIVLVSMMAEFHTSKLRPTIVMFIGLGFSTAMLVVPVLALIILPDAYNIPLGSYNFHSWQILMAVGSIPATLGAILAFFIPESPRFLMSRDRMPEALAVLRKVYSINTGLAPDTYPVKELKSIHVKESETVTADNGDILKDADIQDLGEVKKENSMTAIRGGLNQMKPLFLPPHVYNILIMFAVHFSAVAGCNSLRLWLPQLFKMMSEYSSEGTLCEMISLQNTTIVEVPQPEDGVCEPIQVNSQTYINSIIVASVQVGLMTIASLFINKIGKRRLLTTAFACGGLCSLSLYFCTSTTQATALASVNVAFTMMCSNTVSSILVDLFPTSLRAMAMALVMMMGRIGSITGSVIFPALLALGCLPPFLSIACLLFFGGLMTLMIPRGTTT